MSFVIELSPADEVDLERLFDFLLDRAETTEDLDRAQAAIDAISATTQHGLAITPFSLRKAAQNPAQRELIIPFGGTGYVAEFEIVSAGQKSWCWRYATSVKRTITGAGHRRLQAMRTSPRSQGERANKPIALAPVLLWLPLRHR